MKIRKIMALAVILAIAAGLIAGCNINRDDPDRPLDVANTDQINDLGDDNRQGGDVEGPRYTGINSAARYRHELGLENTDKYQGKTLTIWRFWDVSEEEAETIAAFEAATGATVNFVGSYTYAQYDPDLLKGIATGEGPDICVIIEQIIPAWVMKGYMIPVSDYIDFSQVSFPIAEGTKNYYTFNGKLYVFPDLGEGMAKLYFRRDIFANAGLKNPYELWREGNWTWESFVRLGQDVKQDITGDGETDIWGYYAWRDSQIHYTNGANFVQWIDNKPVQGLDDPKSIRAFEWLRALSEQYDIVAPWDPDLDPQGMLVAGRIAMTYADAYVLDGLRDELGDKLGIAPFPIGPDATAPMGDIATGHREGIAGSSREPELAALYMLFRRLPIDEAHEARMAAEAEPERIRRYGSVEEYEMVLEMAKHAVHHAFTGFTGLDNVITRIRDSEDMTPAQAIETYKASAQNMIDRTWNSD
jgi:multiple sugar transport system substrate-binding protein